MSEPSGQVGERVLRADARRNMEKIRAAAVEVFREQGLGAPLEEIARRAGVRPGTIYHRFGSREGLIDDVVPELAAEQLGLATQDALACPDPWEGFTQYLSRIGELIARDATMCDAVTRRYADTEYLAHACDVARAQEQEIIDRAVLSGSLRTDFTLEDMQLIFWSVAAVARAAAEVAPQAWRRNLALTLQGLRTDDASPLGAAALTPDEVQRIKLRLGATGI
ncbi:TetR/AcrR family transcriptional regulator [Kribbia dieselivorans]|uniref:TetR/AcrR family transcriptional regulator n=1 Tax=Kribbia dieselivorans TaxID=331526 RepID=UPI000838081F|nr:TetR/AcrR family transcriptional regulator [Kribbia dieselivorans]